MATVIFANYPLVQPEIKTTSLEYALYASLSRVGWALALSYIIYACVHGYGGPVNWFLSLSLWQPLSRLSYAIYIIHYPVLYVVMGSAKSSIVVSEFYAVWFEASQIITFFQSNYLPFSLLSPLSISFSPPLSSFLFLFIFLSFLFRQYHCFLGSYILTILASILGSLAFESPIVIIEKLIFGDSKKKEQPIEPTPKSYAPNETA